MVALSDWEPVTNRRLLLSPLWLIAALITLIGLATPPVAANAGPETRVRAFEHVTVGSVGQQSSERPASVGCVRPETADLASGSCVATEAGGLADDAAGSYGPFHRLESPTQTPATAALQEANGGVWGATARGGLNPTVKAYQGPLPPGARGVEFTTPVRPSDVGLGRPGDIAIWRRGSPGVVDVDDDYVKIGCMVVRNTQC
jgi:hypothetical protein